MKINILSNVTVISIIGLVLLISPILFYYSVFGFGVWETHDDWAKMGGALGGIYTPLLSLLTTFLIYKQFALQRDMHDSQLRLYTIANIKSKARESLMAIEKALNQKVGEGNKMEFLSTMLKPEESEWLIAFWFTNKQLKMNVIWLFAQLDTMEKMSHSHLDYLIAYQDLVADSCSRFDSHFLYMLEVYGQIRPRKSIQHFT